MLNFKNTEPPDGWKYLQRETQTWIRAELAEELITGVINHRLYKGLEPADRESVWIEIQRQICLGASPGVCHPEKGEDYIPFKDMARTLSLAKIESASRSLVAWMTGGLNMVSKEESFRRAEICRGCPFNKTASACVCTTFFKAIETMLPDDRKETGLQICTLCGCSLRVKVLAPMSVIREGNPENLRLPDWCWQK